VNDARDAPAACTADRARTSSLRNKLRKFRRHGRYANGTAFAMSVCMSMVRALRCIVLSAGLAAMAMTACSSPPPSASDLDLADAPSDPGAAPRRGANGKIEPVEGESGGGKGLPNEPPATPSGSPPPPPAEGKDAGAPPPPPPEYPFRAIDVRHPVRADIFITQCRPDGATQLVWKTTGVGPDADSSWANPQYTQQPGVYGGCGTKTANEYPIILTSLADGEVPKGSFVAKCTKTKEAHVYRITGTFEGHPMATFEYPEVHAACP
jgi:hypothetical protein